MKDTNVVPGTLSESVPARMSEVSRFYAASTLFLALTGILLYMGLAASYPPVHDALHSVRHALAIVPCH